jgi:hypothetical protein
MTVRAIIYATLFTAGVEALAIYSTQEEAPSGRILAAEIALAAPAPAVARGEWPVAAPSIVPRRIRATIQPTRVAQAPKQANTAGAAMASATGNLDNTRPKNDAMARLYLMVQQQKMVRQRRIVRKQQDLYMTYTSNY